MRTIDRKNLEHLAIDISHPARDIRGVAIGRICAWMPIGRQTRLARRKLVELADR